MDWLVHPPTHAFAGRPAHYSTHVFAGRPTHSACAGNRGIGDGIFYTPQHTRLCMLTGILICVRRDWRRCLQLYERPGHKSRGLSVALGACARWGSIGDTWSLLEQAGGREHGWMGVSSAAACRVWMLANDGGSEGGKSQIRAVKRPAPSAKGGKTGGLRVVRSPGVAFKVNMEAFRERACELVAMRLPPASLQSLIGHPGPPKRFAGERGLGEGDARIRLIKARAHTAYSKGTLSAVVNMLEELERVGYMDMHGCSA